MDNGKQVIKAVEARNVYGAIHIPRGVQYEATSRKGVGMETNERAADQRRKLLTLCHGGAMDITDRCRITATVLLLSHIFWHELALTRHIPSLIAVN
jgi:hypothetical protein